MPNRREQTSAIRHRFEGWKPVRRGAPDWLMVKVEDGRVVDAKFVEVKSPTGRLRYEQRVWREVLEDVLGANYEVDVVE